jgi:PAS domain-containing protein
VDSQPDQRPAAHASVEPASNLARSWPVVVVGLLAFPLTVLLGDAGELWLPAIGLGVALLSWTSWWLLPLLAIELLVCRFPVADDGRLAVLEALLLAGQIGVSWWAYHYLARGSRGLEDPRSCMVFFVLVPGLTAAAFALAQALLWHALRPEPTPPLWAFFGTLWLSRILGVLVPLPLLLVLVTPVLTRHRLVAVPPPSGMPGNPWHRWSRGEAAEVGGLAMSSAVLVVVLVTLQQQQGLPPWSLWGVGLMIVVWSALRQGLAGGVLVAGATALAGLACAVLVLPPADRGFVQGYLLAQGSTALLVGVSSSWIQASEARYRHVFSEVPLVLYSANLPRPLAVSAPNRAGPRGDALGPTISREAVVTLVSRASRQVFDCSPEEMSGPYAIWLSRIVADDRELVIAALEQLGMQRQSVTCEYRVLALAEPPAPAAGVAPLAPALADAAQPRWVRDSLTPHYTDDGLLDGWEGYVEDITERRKLSYNLRRSTGMLQALVANLPAGVFFVQGPMGFPILANARARALLGQREDGSIPLSQLSRLYRLHRPDGSVYPPDELPVAKALRQGVTCTAHDVVVHRPDGRKIPLATWAAPVQLDPGPQPDAAVWVLEDMSAMQQAEAGRRDSEIVLRAVIATMAGGMVVQDAAGTVIECNPAACQILGVSQEELLGHAMLAADTTYLTEDGRPLPRENCPDLQALRSGQAVRDRVVGIVRTTTAPRWFLFNALPLPAGPALGANPRHARIVTTFTEIGSPTA